MLLTQKDIPLVLIGKGGSEMYQEVERLGVAPFFSEILFKQGPKKKDVFQPFISKMLPEETVLIGDRVRSEVALGNSLHATTIWVKQGKFAAEEPVDSI